MAQKIAILISSTSRNCDYTSSYEFLYLTITESTLIKTAKNPDLIKVFIGYDDDDLYFEIERENILRLTKLDTELIPFHNISEGNPCFVWNKLFELAYSQGYDYFLQLGDDCEIQSENWDEKCINILKSHNNIGVTGFRSPWGEVFINAFISKTHYEIFNYLYDPIFTNFDSDVWLTKIYAKEYTYFDNSLQLKNKIVQIEGNQNKQKYIRYIPKKIQNLDHFISVGKEKILTYLSRQIEVFTKEENKHK